MRCYSRCLPISLPPQTLGPSLYAHTEGLHLSPPGSLSFSARRSCRASRSARERNESFRQYVFRKRCLSAPYALDSSNGSMAKDTVKKRLDLSDDEEKDMLDYLYTTQYQMSGILAVSLGRIADPNSDGFTHVVFMRFQKKGDLVTYYDNTYYLGVLKEHIMPYCYGWTSVDYESEVEDDILPIFRRGEEFKYGVEFVLLISMFEDAQEDAVVDALTNLSNLIVEFESLMVQATQGSNFNLTGNDYTHGAVIRFPSLEALEMFRSCAGYKNMWRKIHQVARKALAVHFTVDPVGTEIM